MHAVVLAAGFGERMRDLVKQAPKALLPLAGGTVLDRVVTSIWVDGITCIHVLHNAGWAAMFKRWKNGLRWLPQEGKKTGTPYIRIYNTGAYKPEHRRGSVGDLGWFLQRLSRRGGVLVVCADNLFRFTPEDLAELEGNGEATSAITVRPEGKLRPTVLGANPSWVQVEAGLVTEVTDTAPERPTPWRFCGPAYLSDGGIGHLRDYAKFCETAGVLADTLGGFFDWLKDKEPVRAVKKDDGRFFDLGTVNGYQEAAGSLGRGPAPGGPRRLTGQQIKHLIATGQARRVNR